jgi:two-component system sensor histidine kinase YesM
VYNIWNPIKKYRIDNLFFGIFAGFIIVLLFVVIWFSYSYSSRELVSNTSFYQQGLLNELYKQLTIQLNSIEQISLATSRNVGLMEFLEMKEAGYTRYVKQKEIEMFLAQITYSSTIIESIDLYMRNAPISKQDFAIRLIEHGDMFREKWYPALQNTDFIWIGENNIQTNKGNVAVISFARKIYSDFGQYQGLLMMNIKAPAIQSIIKGEKENLASNRLLLDLNGRPITNIGDPLSQEQIAPYIGEMEDKSGYLRLSNVDVSGVNRDYLIVWSNFFDSDWLLVEITPWGEITQGSVKMAVVLSVIGLAAVIIALFFTLFISRQFTKPIRLLLMEMGNFTVKKPIHLPMDYKNEFGVMFNGYRRLNNRILELYQSLKEQYKAQKEAELKALQAMINPHFLYNTLDQLNWMAIEQGQGKISHILELIGKMFRIGLSNGEGLITIREELTHMSCYIQIHQIGWGESLNFNIDVPEDFMDLYIPKLTLQPFVENAIMHGFHGRTGGFIEIKAVQEEDALLFSVSDNGVGIKSNWQANKRKTGGYGIRNVTERIEAYFDSPYGVQIVNKAEGGTIVYIRIPHLKERTR